MPEINSYEGPGYVEGAPPGLKRKSSFQSIKETHRDVMDAHERNGIIALNAMDFEKTRHLPVGRGRLACDENGEFDKRARRPHYSPSAHPPYPRQLHSTITEGEYKDVRNREEHMEALSTRLWSETPLERKKRFMLTDEQAMQGLSAEIKGERAARLALEKQLEKGVIITEQPADNYPNQLAMEEMKAENQALKDRLDQLFSILEAQNADRQTSRNPLEEDEEEVATTSKKRK
jgi:hypothetical protein